MLAARHRAYRSQLPPPSRRMHLHLDLLQFVQAFPYGAALGADSVELPGPRPPPLSSTVDCPVDMLVYQPGFGEV